MTAESPEPASVETRWWQYRWSFRVPTQAGMWVLAAIGAAWLVASLHSAILVHGAGSWGDVFGAAAYGGIVVLVGRWALIAVGLDGTGLLVRRALPGRAERIPWDRVRRVWVVDDLLGIGVIFLVSRALPMQFYLHHFSQTVPGHGELLAALKAQLAPVGKWWD